MVVSAPFSRSFARSCRLFLALLASLGTIQALVSDTTPEHTGSYCNTDIFRAQCPEGWVVMMTSAWYGRMKIGKCVKFQIGSGSCGRDVLLLVDRRCSGKRMCDIRIPDAELESSKPCGKELKNYLEASYVCLRVETVTSDECQSSTNLQVSFASGYLGSIINSDTPHCDGAYHPWVIKGQPGQRVNLTLYDFALDAAAFGASSTSIGGAGGGYVSSRHEDDHGRNASFSRFPSGQLLPGNNRHPTSSLSSLQLSLPPPPSSSSSLPSSSLSSSSSSSQYCVKYGLIEDGDVRKEICGGHLRVRHLHYSENSLIKVRLTAGSAPTDLKRYVIKYEVIGCTDPTHIPENAWFKRKTIMPKAILSSSSSSLFSSFSLSALSSSPSSSASSSSSSSSSSSVFLPSHSANFKSSPSSSSLSSPNQPASIISSAPISSSDTSSSSSSSSFPPSSSSSSLTSSHFPSDLMRDVVVWGCMNSTLEQLQVECSMRTGLWLDSSLQHINCTIPLVDVLMNAELDMSLRHSNKKARDNKENNNSNPLWKNKPFLVGITSGMIAVTVFTSILICYFAFQFRRTRKKNKQRHKVVDNNSSHQRSDAVNDFDHQLSCPSINNISNVNIHNNNNNNNNIIPSSIISSNNIFPNQAEIKPLIKPGMNNDQQKYYKHHSLSRSQQSHNHIHHQHDVVFEETSLAFNKFSTNQYEMSFVKQHPSKTLMPSKNIYNPPTNNNFNNCNNNNYNNNYSYSSGCQTLRSTNTLPLYSPQQKFHQNYHQQQTHEQHQNKQQQQQQQSQCCQQNSNTQQQTSKQQQIATIFPTQYVANTKNNNIANSLCFQHSSFSSSASTATSAATAATTSNATKSVTWSPVLDQLLMMPHEDSSFSDETTAINNFNNSAILQPNKIQLTFCNNDRKSSTLNRYNNNNNNNINNTLFKDIYSDFSYDPYSRDNNNNTTLCTSSNKDNNTSLINDPYPNANADSLSSSLTSLLNNQSDDTCRLTPVLEDASNVVVDRCSAFEPVAVRAKNKTLLTDV